jgi:hypothetical protein
MRVPSASVNESRPGLPGVYRRGQQRRRVLISSVSVSRTGVLAYAAVPRGRNTGLDVVFNWMQLLKLGAGAGLTTAGR